MMPFALTNAFASFQRFISNIFAEKLDIFVIVYLDDIFIDTDNDEDSHITAIRWVLGQLRKYLLYTNLKKCRFHQEEVWFFGYIVSLKCIHIEDERIEVVKQWPEVQSVRDIQVFLRFANFYRRFILGFSQIAVPLTLMLKTSRSIESLIELGKGGVGVGDDIRAESDGSELDGSEVDGGKDGDKEVGKKVQKLFKSKNLSKFKKMVRSDFLIPKAKLVFEKLRQAFVKVPILYHFDSERHI